MAHVSKEMKAKTAPIIKQILSKYQLKGSLSVHNHSTLVLTVRQGPIDFIAQANVSGQKIAQQLGREHYEVKDHVSVNVYWYHDHYTGEALDFLKEAVAALKGPDYFDHSDSRSDYFHCSHYVDVNIGRWDKPYALVA